MASTVAKDAAIQPNSLSSQFRNGRSLFQLIQAQLPFRHTQATRGGCCSPPTTVNFSAMGHMYSLDTFGYGEG